MQRNVWVYSSMVAALVRQQDVEGAQSMVEAMRADGVTPNTVVFNTLLQAYADSETAVARVGVDVCLRVWSVATCMLNDPSLHTATTCTPLRTNRRHLTCCGRCAETVLTPMCRRTIRSCLFAARLATLNEQCRYVPTQPHCCMID